MKVICDRGALLESINIVQGVVPSRTPKPVLTCIKLVAQGGRLTLAATDLEASVRVSTPRVEVAEEGQALVQADKLGQIVRESLDATLSLTTEQDATHIRGQDSHFKVFGYPPSEFPELSDLAGDADFEISAGSLSQIIHQTLYATARENSRYAINGVLMERDGSKMTVVATDGHRLALARTECKSLASQTTQAIIPTRTLNLLLKLLGEPEQPVKARVAGNQILFSTGSATLASNLVEGNFPPYKDVIPRDGDKRATLKTDVLISAFRRAALLTNEESKGVRMSFSKEGLSLTSRAPELGEAEIKVDVPDYQGDPLDIGFNPAYMLDALKVVGEDQVMLDLRAANKPGVLRTGTSFVYVIMPVNLQ